MYRTLQAALIFYQKILKCMDSQGFYLNLYDPCVVNKMVNGDQMSIFWQVDDLNILQVYEKEVLRIIEWMKIMYDEDIMVAQRNKHEYLVIDINLSIPLKVMVTMVDFN